MHPDLSEVLLSEEDLSFRINELGREIAVEYADKKPIIVSTLKGSVVFMCDLVRCMHPLPEALQIEYIRASSYGNGTESSGNVRIGMSTISEEAVRGRHLLLVEDIVDSGLTGQGLVEYFSKHAPASIKMVSLLSKPSRRQVPFEPDYLGFTIEDRFVVGFGLDYQERYRSLPYIGILRQEKVNE